PSSARCARLARRRPGPFRLLFVRTRPPPGPPLFPYTTLFRSHHARHVMDSVNDAMRHASLLPQSAKGTIRLAATYTVLGYFLPDLLSRFKRSYPQVEIDLVDMDRAALESALAEESIDLGIGLLSNIGRQDDYGHRLLVRSRRRVWAGVSHPLARQTTATLQEIAEHPYIMLTVD